MCIGVGPRMNHEYRYHSQVPFCSNEKESGARALPSRFSRLSIHLIACIRAGNSDDMRDRGTGTCSTHSGILPYRIIIYISTTIQRFGGSASQEQKSLNVRRDGS
jgi:hypothetical protein